MPYIYVQTCRTASQSGGYGSENDADGECPRPNPGQHKAFINAAPFLIPVPDLSTEGYLPTISVWNAELAVETEIVIVLHWQLRN